MDNVSDIRNYMKPEQLEALAKEDVFSLVYMTDQDNPPENLLEMTLDIMKVLELKYTDVSSQTKARSCFEVLSLIVSVANDNDFENAKGFVAEWFEDFETITNMKRKAMKDLL